MLKIFECHSQDLGWQSLWQFPTMLYVKAKPIEYFFARYKTRYQPAFPQSLWERFYLRFEKSQGRRHSLRR
jgi:hypothetical protein